MLLNKFFLCRTQRYLEKSKEIKIQENEKKIIKDNNLDQDLPQTVFDKEKIDLSVNKINQSGEIIDDEIIFGLYEPQEININLKFLVSCRSKHL